MLVRFKLRNFLSYGEEQEFSMISGKARSFPEHIIDNGNIQLVKSGVIYGANASGKSNMIQAIDFSRSLIVNGIENTPMRNKTFRLIENKKNVSRFEYEVCIDNKIYAYGYEIDLLNRIIVEEWLFELKKTNEICIFERNTKNNKINTELKFNNKDSMNRFDIYKDDIKGLNSTFLLSNIATKNIKKIPELQVFVNVYNWFKDKITIIYPNSVYRGINFINDDNKLKKLYSNMLNYFDTGIDDLTHIELDFDDFVKQHSGDLPNDLEDRLFDNQLLSLTIDKEIYSVFKLKNTIRVLKLSTQHNISNDKSEIFDFGSESDGTRRLFDLIPILQSNEKDIVIFIDEIDRSLHTNLTYNFIKLFLSMNNNSSQLVVTTHDSNLLNQKLLRRDEIWFVSKDEKKSSKIYSLDEFQVRYDKEIRKAYLSGRYGAVPNFKESYFNYLGD